MVYLDVQVFLYNSIKRFFCNLNFLTFISRTFNSFYTFALRLKITGFDNKLQITICNWGRLIDDFWFDFFFVGLMTVNYKELEGHPLINGLNSGDERERHRSAIGALKFGAIYDLLFVKESSNFYRFPGFIRANFLLSQR